MGIGDMMGMMKQAKQLQEKMQAMQEEIATMSVQGVSGGGLVSVVTSGKGDVRSLKIDPSLAKPEEVEILEDLIVAALADARGKAEAAVAEKMHAMTGGLGLPAGMKLPF